MSKHLSTLPAQRKHQQGSYRIHPDDHELIRDLERRGFQHKRIAALFDVNQGRISEICKPDSYKSKS